MITDNNSIHISHGRLIFTRQTKLGDIQQITIKYIRDDYDLKQKQLTKTCSNTSGNTLKESMHKKLTAMTLIDTMIKSYLHKNKDVAEKPRTIHPIKAYSSKQRIIINCDTVLCKQIDDKLST